MSFIQRSNVLPFPTKAIWKQTRGRDPDGLDLLLRAIDLAQQENANELSSGLIDAIYSLLDARAAQQASVAANNSNLF